MTLAERLRALAAELPPDWTEAAFDLTVDEAQAGRAAFLLASLSPGRSGASFRLRLTPTGKGGASVDAATRVLARLDEEAIDARLSLPEREEAVRVAPPPAEAARAGLAEAWDEALAALPADWSDLYLEVELRSSADLDRAALLLGPVNPFLQPSPRPHLRFRSARRFGYGAAPQVARRALARLDEEKIAGVLRVLRARAAVTPVAAQGPVWREAGRSI